MWWIWGCAAQDVNIPEEKSQIHIMYGNNMDGEIEPCG